ncbi:transposase family protein [Nocardia spumae]|uniref:transposase family protein n=1 Tax=Nocardia spumae TaxID=2887190 RepID=UPI001D134C9C|nr:transposase family protein [Nocardia spumae]
MSVLFPHLDGPRIEVIRAAGSTVRIDAVTGGHPVDCPGCGTLSGRVHSQYQRRLSDTAITGREAVIGFRVRRLFCDNSDCGRRTFVERVPQLADCPAREANPVEPVNNPVVKIINLCQIPHWRSVDHEVTVSPDRAAAPQPVGGCFGDRAE